MSKSQRAFLQTCACLKYAANHGRVSIGRNETGEDWCVCDARTLSGLVAGGWLHADGSITETGMARAKRMGAGDAP